MSIIGLRDTSNFVTDQRPKNWREGILLLDPNGMSPLTALTSLMKSGNTDDPEYNWWEKELADQRIDLLAANPLTGAGAPGSVVTINFAGALAGAANPVTKAGIKPGHMLLAEQTGELFLVTAVTGTTVVTVRGKGTAGSPGGTVAAVTPATTGVNPWFLIVGTAYEEGSARPVGINYDPTKRFNYTQIFRSNLEITGTAAETNLRTGDQVREAKREALLYHGVEIEKAFLFGEKVESTLNGRPWRLTQGIMSFITTLAPQNVKSFPSTGNVSLADFEIEMEKAFRFGSSEKMAFMGNRALLAIQQFARKNSTYQLMQGQKEFGMNVSRLISPFGELVLKTHKLFNQILSGLGGTTPGQFFALDTTILIVDMDRLKYRPLRGRDTKFLGDQQDRGEDAMKSGYLTEAGLELHHAKAHYIMKNVFNGIVDP